MAHAATSSFSAAETAQPDTELDAQKRAFLRMISHELRTPLNSILGFSEILASELYGPLGSPPYKEYAEIIHGSGRRLLKLVNQVLEIARLDGRAIDFNLRAEPLEAALDEVLATLGADLAARSVRVDIQNRVALPSVMADPRGLRTVLVNLLQNAVTHSLNGGVVRVSAALRRGEVDIRIQDQGPGIEPSQISRLLGAFEQGEIGLTRTAEGAGLGLPICELTCKAMSGRMVLNSPEGEGLTVIVTLPRA